MFAGVDLQLFMVIQYLQSIVIGQFLSLSPKHKGFSVALNPLISVVTKGSEGNAN